jgi:hypothetical protein
MIITVSLIYTNFKSLQLQHTLSLLLVTLSSLVITGWQLLTLEVPHGHPWTSLLTCNSWLLTNDSDLQLSNFSRWSLLYIASAWTALKTLSPAVPLLLRVYSMLRKYVYLRRCLSIGSHGLGLVARFVAKNLHLFYISFSSVYALS